MTHKPSIDNVNLQPPKVMVVEDEPRLREMLLHAIPSMGFTCSGARSAEESLRQMDQAPADLLVLDLNLPGMDGLTFFEQVRERWPQTQVVILTGFGDLETARQAIRLSVADFLTKPCHLGDLEQALDRARKKWASALARTQPPRPTLSFTDHEPGEEPEPAELAEGDADPNQTLRDIERQHILAALERNAGNRAATAKELGISVRKLYYRIAQYQEEGRIN